MNAIARGLLLSALITAEAQAAGTKEDWDDLGQPVVNDFADCTLTEVDKLISSTRVPVEVADAAIDACASHLEPLRDVLADAPFSDNPQTIDAVMNHIRMEARSVIAALVEKRRAAGDD